MGREGETADRTLANQRNGKRWNQFVRFAEEEEDNQKVKGMIILVFKSIWFPVFFELKDNFNIKMSDKEVISILKKY